MNGVPAQAKPYVPIAEEVKKDDSRTVPGLESAPPVAQVKDTAVKAEKEVQLDEEEKAAQDKADTDVLNDVLTACPNCGLTNSEKNSLVTPTDDDKRAWIRHILGAERFVKDYSVMGGNIKLFFRTRTTVENDLIFVQLNDEIKTGRLPSDPSISFKAYHARMVRLMATCSLLKVEPVMTTELPAVTAEAYPGEAGPLTIAFDKVLQLMSEGLLSIVLAKQNHFDSLVRTLIARTDDPDFWKPTAGQS